MSKLNTKDIPFTNVELLSRNIDAPYNENLKGELGFSRYRMDNLLKDYAGLSKDFTIHAFFEHGILFTDYCGGAFRAHEYLPSVVASNYRVSVLEKQENYNGAYAIGPYIHYAEPLLSKEQIKEEKERLGRNLLVFPSHSVDEASAKFDFNEFCSKIDKIAKDFDSVRMCLYYRDIQLKNHIPYLKKGFEVVTAGHLHDTNFLSRQKSIILTSDVTMANDIGTHLGYSIYLNKPHFLLKQNIRYDFKSNDLPEARTISKAFEIKNKHENVKKIEELFSSYGDKISKEQYDLISYLWGFKEVKTNNELKKLLLDIEDNYSPIKYYFSGLKRLIKIIKEGRGS